jgi:[ribosomal protein S18]-alanine N-acetyltransferase
MGRGGSEGRFRLAAVQVAIRESRPADFDELWKIDQACFEPGISYSRAELQHYMRSRGAFTLIACDKRTPGPAGAEANGGCILGFVIGQKNARDNGHIITIDVVESARRDGVGSSLMNAAEERLRGAGCAGIYLEVAVNNAKALAFYKRHGFTILKTIPHYYQDGVDAFVMGKLLSGPSLQPCRSR